MAEQADGRNQHHHERQHHRQPRQHLQFQVFEIGAQRQAQRRDDGKQHDTEAELGFAEGQGDQHRGEGAQGLDADQVAQDQDHQHADRDHHHDHEGLLGLQRQAVQRVFEEVGVGVFVGQLGQANGVHFAVVQAEGHVGFLATIDGDQVFVAGPPQQAVGRQALFTGFRVEVQPVGAIEAAQPQFRHLRLIGHQADGVDLLDRHMGDGQQQLDDFRLVRRGWITGQQQFHVVVVEVVDPLDGFADESFDIGRVLANRCEQGFGGDFFRAFDGHAVAKGRAFDLGFLTGITLGQHQAVIQRLIAFGPACRPGDLAVAVDPVHGHAVVVGDEALVEAHEVAAQRRHEHLDLDRILGTGDELDLGVDVPQVVGGVFGHRDAQHEDLIGRN
ncbi:hypothetical protein D3C75_599320 [compost metagenome]